METALQKVLRSKLSLEDLKEQYGINYYEHPELPLVGFKYNMIEAPKTDPVVRASRGTVLERGTWNIVAQPFFRFFNYGEHQEETHNFDFTDFTAMTKEDGSLMIVYYYKNEWHVNTSGSFGLLECGFSNKTWRELFWETSGIDQAKLSKTYTYIFEMCTLFNKVVRMYETPRVYLLGVRDNASLHEYPTEYVKFMADGLGVDFPETHSFSSYEEIESFLQHMEETDSTFEGLVLRDCNNVRVKVKTKTYLALHHLADNGNIANPKNIIPFILAGETDEVLTYFPELQEQVDSITKSMDKEYAKLRNLWRRTYYIDKRKSFALAIVKNTPFSGLLFKLRDQHGTDQSEEHLETAWRESGDLIHKVLYKGE